VEAPAIEAIPEKTCAPAIMAVPGSSQIFKDIPNSQHFRAGTRLISLTL
jgi:hypothetical protein